MSQPCQMNAPQGSSVRNPVSGPPRSEEVNTPSIMRPGIDLERQAGNWGSRCIMLQANRMVTLYDEAEKAFKSGTEDANTDEKLVEEYLKYGADSNKPGARTRQARQLFLEKSLAFLQSYVKRRGRLDQLICLAGYIRVGRVLLKPFLSGQEEVGDNDQYLYNEGAIRFISITIFSSIIALFACAPAAIQSLNVRSTVGEVVVYLVFVIVFGWLSQGLILGFEKVLLSCLAYAGLMATLLRGG
ncbi:hypothetical protein F25303_3848 [Fusarium sp. NRRL 25303]|nr:hypothetical protein F25303_3848 [Fusarium sp. NRRL 25303]